MRWNILLFFLLMPGLTVGSLAGAQESADAKAGCKTNAAARKKGDFDPLIEKKAKSAARESGWLKSYKRGKRVLEELSAFREKNRKQGDITKYWGETVAFLGAGTATTNDLTIDRGFYLRVVTKTKEDLRFPATAWSVLVHGKILDVFLENKVIVLEVSEKGWCVLVAA